MELLAVLFAFPFLMKIVYCKVNETNYLNSCYDVSGDGSSCYRLAAANTTQDMKQTNCSGLPVNLDKAIEADSAVPIQDAESAKMILFLGVFRKMEGTYLKDISWIWIDGRQVNGSFQSQQNSSAFESYCSHIFIIGTDFCYKLPCGENCSNLCEDQCTSNTFGSLDGKGRYSTPVTSYDKILERDCSYGPPGVRINAHCTHPWKKTADAQWTVTNQAKCWNREDGLKNLFETKLDEKNVANVTKTLKHITEGEPDQLKSSDIAIISTVLDSIASIKQRADEVSGDFYGIINNILNVNHKELLKSEKENSSSSRIIKTVQNLTRERSFPDENESEDTSLTNMAISLVNISSGHTAQFTVTANSSVFQARRNQANTENQSDFIMSITLPEGVFGEKYSKVPFILYRKPTFFRDNVNQKIRDYVIAASVQGKRVHNLSVPVIIRYPSSEKYNSSNPVCVFRKFRGESGDGKWSRDGCKFDQRDDYDECHCNHLTNFAMLLDVQPDEEPKVSAKHRKSLSLISYIGCSVSLLGILLTILTILCFRDLHASKTSKIFLNICIALAGGLLMFLAAAEERRTYNDMHCVAAGIAIHLFFLAALFWMVMEAYTMFLAFVMILPKASLDDKIPSPWVCCLICWGFPSAIVGTTAGLTLDSYAGDGYCMLQGWPMFYAFFLPVALCTLLNTIVFLFILHCFRKSGSTVTSTIKTSGIERVRRGLAVSVFLGLTWVSGFFAIGDARLLFQYIFCVVNSLQGWMIFIFYCVLSTEVRARIWKRVFGSPPEDPVCLEHRLTRENSSLSSNANRYQM